MKVLHQSVKAFLLEGNLWHKRLGNPVNQALKMVGITPSLDTWEVCLTGKSSLLPFSGNWDKAQHSLEYINLDGFGSKDPISNNRLKDLLTIVYQFTSLKSVLFLKTKSEAF
ncbi:hypothetical protein O181_097353 [Austropuccinia psidii MF-1]|uniref:Uncharacterized protein n=1 Tax=Austropuccinia psidii MF-1 TaxID=1389203 RepID=A0A9Q3J8S0_9BASI|nr:hypothetical protein [Austropuccinia psidii MF-1]